MDLILKRHNFICYVNIFVHVYTYVRNNSKILLPNFKAVDKTQAELHIFKIELLAQKEA